MSIGSPKSGEGGSCRVSVACTPFARLRGLGALPAWQGVLMLAPCADIHTWFVRRPIDVAFVSADGRVLKTHRGLGPGSRRRCKGACYTLERWADAGGAWFKEGDVVSIS